MREFWMLHAKGGGLARHEYQDEGEAMKEATRLLRMGGVTQVFLLKAVAMVEPEEVFPVRRVALSARGEAPALVEVAA